jgi:hypothetical protein
LVGDELVEIGVGEHPAHARPAVAKGDVFQRAGGDVAIEGLDRTTKLGGGLTGSLEPIR